MLIRINADNFVAANKCCLPDCSHHYNNAPQVGNAVGAAADSRATTDDVIGNRKKKSRTVFSRRQVLVLETTFAVSRYLSSVDRCRLAARLQLSETQVKIWFQNRRNKWKRQTGVVTTAPTIQAQHLTPRRASADEDSAWNVGGGVTSRETRDIALIETADKYRRHSLGDTTGRSRLLPSIAASMHNSLPLPTIICPVLSFPNCTNRCLPSIPYRLQ